LKQEDFLTWLRAARPQTLAAAIVPVMTGAALAVHAQTYRWDTTMVALFCAFAIQVGTNFANDYFDFVKGADTPDRIGFERAVAGGLIPPKTMLKATVIAMSLAFFAGLYLVWIGGWVILVIGILSLLFGVLYTGGPFPLGYNGLGDLFVFIFFGIIAVMGTYYINALEWSITSFFASIPVGALCVNILVVNNLRDVEQDRVSGKRTLGVLIGEQALKWEYLIMLVLSFSVPLWLFYSNSFDIWILLPFAATPFAWWLTRKVWNHTDKRSLNPVLERTAQFMLLFGILFAAGMIL